MSRIAPFHLEALGSVLGPSGLIAAPADMARYERGARHDAGTAAFVARPAATEEVSRVVAYCASHSIPLVPQSGNTGLVAGSTPDGTSRQGILSLDRLRGIFELDAANRSVRVSAGLRLSEINARLAEHGFVFPIDLGADPCAGGMAATNTGGARFLRFGDVRRNTLGLEVVFADLAGSIQRFGRGLRKDNTGPDWKQMFIGTGGAFGVITECTFNIERLPRQAATAYLLPAGDDCVMPLLSILEEKAGSYLSAFESMSGAAMRHALAHMPSLPNPFPAGAIPELVLLVELTRSWAPREHESPLEAVLEAILSEIWEGPGDLLRDAFVGHPDRMWALRHALPEGLRSAGYVVGLDLAFSREAVMPFRARMREALPRHFPAAEICDYGHVGDGGLHFNVVLPRSGDTPAEEAETLREFVVTAAVEQFGGSFSAEHGLGRRNQRHYDRYTGELAKRLARMFKAHTSPADLGTIRLEGTDYDLETGNA